MYTLTLKNNWRQFFNNDRSVPSYSATLSDPNRKKFPHRKTNVIVTCLSIEVLYRSMSSFQILKKSGLHLTKPLNYVVLFLLKFMTILNHDCSMLLFTLTDKSFTKIVAVLILFVTNRYSFDTSLIN
jgi:hypothetical protein